MWMMFGLGTLVCKNTGRNRRVGGRAVGGEGEFSSILDKLHYIPGVGVSWRSAERCRHRADTRIPRVVVAGPRGEWQLRWKLWRVLVLGILSWEFERA